LTQEFCKTFFRGKDTFFKKGKVFKTVSKKYFEKQLVTGTIAWRRLDQRISTGNDVPGTT
jgi:hypothetical protein